MNFRKATDELFNRVDHGTLARELGVSVASIRQARLRSDSAAYRLPPNEWQQAILALSRARIQHYKNLVEELEKQGADPTDG
jgi:hypothetical protein